MLLCASICKFFLSGCTFMFILNIHLGVKLLGSMAYFWRRKWQPTPAFLPGGPMDGKAWWATVHRVVKSRTRLSDLTNSHPYMTTTRKTIALTRQTFVGKVISLLFNILSRFVIAFLPGSKHLVISWLQSPPAVIFEPQK